MSVLSKILTQKKSELPALRQRSLPAAPPHRPVALKRGSGEPLRLIAEIKRKSPSAGPLNTKLSVADRAAAYEAGGATMISVLCDEEFFDGGYDYLTEARAGAALPLLCKEFIIDECQLDAAHAYGASAALLIVRCLTPERLERLILAARERQLLPLVEVFTEEEAKVALNAGATDIGVNARDLDTLEMDAARAARVVASLPEGIARAQFSGIKSAEAVSKAASEGADAALIGEVLMKQDDPTALLRSFAAVAG